MPNSSSFTITATGGLLRAVLSQCHVAPAFDPATQPAPQFHQFQALWDTGATNSCISPNVVAACALAPIGMVQVNAFNSSHFAEVYLVSVGLPNNVAIQSVRVSRGDMSGGFDVVIGMDIITLGDLVITNRNGNTVFSFCFPSHRCIDFVKEHNDQLKASRPGFRGFTPPKPAGGNKKRHRR